MKVMRAFALAAAAASGTGAFAAGAYDGIYNVPNSPLYVSVHQNGNHIVAGQFYSVSKQELNLGSDPQIPPTINLWDVFGGDISGNTVTVSGEALLGACNLSYRLTFDASGMAMQLTAASNTAYGNQLGFNCAGLAAGSTSVRATRVF
jgi:hypothetical protein